MGNVRLYGATSGYTELAPPAVAPDGVLSLPSGVGTLAKETGAWTAWTPTWSGITLGNSTVDAAYVQFGKTVTFRLKITVGSTASGFGRMVFSLPVSENTDQNDFQVKGSFADASPAANYLMAPVIFNGNIYCDVWVSSGTYLTRVVGTSTVPFSPATGDILRINGTYEAA